MYRRYSASYFQFVFIVCALQAVDMYVHMHTNISFFTDSPTLDALIIDYIVSLSLSFQYCIFFFRFCAAEFSHRLWRP